MPPPLRLSRHVCRGPRFSPHLHVTSIERPPNSGQHPFSGDFSTPFHSARSDRVDDRRSRRLRRSIRNNTQRNAAFNGQTLNLISRATYFPSSDVFTGAIPAGTGFLVYVFADDVYRETEEDPFPKDLTLTGNRHSGEISPPMNENGDGWTLVGNPYGRPIGFSEVINNTGTMGLTEAAYVYDPNATDIDPAGPVNGNGGAWRSIAGDFGDIPSGNIAPGQGFFVQTAEDASDPSLTFSPDNQTGGGQFYGKEKQLRDFVRLEIQGESLYNSAWIRFSEEGSTERTEGEALELQPLDSNYALLGPAKPMAR